MRRKSKLGTKRYPNGTPYRHKTKEQQQATAIAAREKHFALSKDDAATDLAGYAIGRMALKGSLGSGWRSLVDAANAYVVAAARYMRVKYPSYPIPKAMDYLAAKGIGGDTGLAEVNAIVRRYEDYRAILSRVDGTARMKFHETAFMDAGETREHVQAVIICASALCQGLEKRRKS